VGVAVPQVLDEGPAGGGQRTMLAKATSAKLSMISSLLALYVSIV
jgi:hypothetical protein